MFSAFSTFSNPFRLPQFFGGISTAAIDIKSVEIHDVETLQEKRARTLKHLLKLNHVNHSIMYHNLEFHNHIPHILGSAYLLGAEAKHLNAIYDADSEGLEAWRDSPGEISTYDWRDFLGDRRYQRAYVDFFEDQLVLNGYNWQKVLNEYLLGGKEPLINGLVGGVGHPLIHLGYAFELSSRELAMESLGLASTSYNFLHKYLDDPSYTKPTSRSTQSPLEIICRLQADSRFDGLFEHGGADNIELVFEKRETEVLEHWNSWQISNPTKDFEGSQKLAAALLVAAHKPDGSSFDFFIVHLLTTSHAVRIVLPFLPAKFHIPLVRQWWLLTIAVYIAQLRPEISLTSVTDFDRQGRGWNWVDKQAIEGKHALDEHYVKAVRALKEAARTWGDEDEFYLKAAVKFADNFNEWGGFGI